MMAIKVGDKLPSIDLQHKIDDQVETINSDALFGGKKVVARHRTCLVMWFIPINCLTRV
jgi:peroxiredoxin